jgi:putative ABC transport system substrate-binding protein
MTKPIIGFALCAMLLALCSSAEAQEPAKMSRIGVLVLGTSEAFTPLHKALEEGLRELGYVERRNIVIEYRFADGRTARLRDLATELVRLKLDVILAITNSETAVLKQATTTTPIVMVHTSDPVDAALIHSLARPGANITGLSISASPELLAKRLELLKEVIPKVSRLAILRQADVPGRAESFAAVENAARQLKVVVQFVDVHGPDEFESAFATMIRNRAEAFLIAGGPVTWMRRHKIAELAAKNRLPGSHTLQEYAEAGLLMTYGPNLEALYRRAAVYVDKILKGAKPADLPVERPTKFELVINLKTAKQIGLTIPPNVLARADRVIR